jgi:Fe-S cluster assembly scaffold protein SufB
VTASSVEPAEIDRVAGALREMGADSAVLTSSEVAHMVAIGRNLVSLREIPGVSLQVTEGPEEISLCLKLEREKKIANPIHLCIGVLNKSDIQRIKVDVRAEERSTATLMAHCFFPTAVNVEHIMDALMNIETGAELRYLEGHYHGPWGGVTVLPKAQVRVGPHARFFADFSLITGRVGKLRIKYYVEGQADAVAELSSRVFGHATDEIKIEEEVILAGKSSRGLVKIRVALEDQATAEVTGMTAGNAEGARGHVDCMEIVKDQASARAVPVVSVTHPLAKVTHEAAIGSIDKKQLESLMARGVPPRRAVDMIVRGILR